MHPLVLALSAVLFAAVGGQAQTGNPLNGFLSLVGSVVSDIAPSSTAALSTTSISATSTSQPTPSTDTAASQTSGSAAQSIAASSSTPTSTLAASTVGTAAAAASATTSSTPSHAASGGLSQRDKIILAVCLTVGVLILLAFSFCLWWCLRRRRKRQVEMAHEDARWEKAGLHRSSADEAALSQHHQGYEARQDHHDRAAAARAAEMARHSAASDQALISGAHDPDFARMSGASEPYHSGNRQSHGHGIAGLTAATAAETRHSSGSGISGPSEQAMTASPASAIGPAMLRRKPVPGRNSEHHAGAALGAGAVGAALGAAAYRHHNNTHTADRGGHTAYVEDNHRYGDSPHPHEEDRPPTPFGLAAYNNEPAHRGGRRPHGDALEGMRRSGSFPDPSVADHYQHHPSHERPAAFHPRWSPPEHDFATGNDGEIAYIPYTPSGPYDAASAASQPRRHSAPWEPPRPKPMADREERNGHRSWGPPRPALAPDDRQASNGPASRVPAAALGAVGRDSPRIMARSRQAPGAWQGESSDSSSGRSVRGPPRMRVSSGPPDHRAPKPPPAYASYPSYSSASEGPTPMYEIPGAFPPERGGRHWRPAGPGMRDEGGNGSPRSGRRLRFSDHNEEIEPEPGSGEMGGDETERLA